MKNKVFVNRYHLLEKLGEGGMGDIWRVLDEVEKKEIALKEIKIKSNEEKLPSGSRMGAAITPTNTTNSELRFAEEFRTMTKLAHPNTVKVFDYGVLDNGNRYLTMEIVEGEELSEILKKRKLELSEVYKISIKLCQVLSFIHSRLLVHRDIKPENIKITLEGEVKLMDFGLMDQIGIASSGVITGTIAYLPPEVSKGGVVDARSDLYSLGCLMYELVAGCPPFKAEKTIDVIIKHINVLPKPLSEVRQDIPSKLNQIIMKLLEKDQDDRYSTTAELVEDLSKLSGYEAKIGESLEQKKSYLFCSKLIGRNSEFEQMREIFNKMKKKKGQSVFIGAPAGVGKTRLIQEFKLETQLSEVPYVQGFCTEQKTSNYKPIKEALRSIVPLTKKEIMDKYGSILVKLFPELEDKGYKPSPELAEVAEKMQLIENVINWLKDVSEYRSFAICIEDMHWADSATLDLLNNCIRGLKDSSVMFLGTFRDDEVDDTSSLFFTIEEGLTEFMKLSLLNEKYTVDLIEAMLGKIELTENFIEYIFKTTQGNPFFITEVMRSLIEVDEIKLIHGCWKLPDDVTQLYIPPSISETITRRLNLELLSSETFYLIQIASVLGREIDLSLMLNICSYKKEKFLGIIDELIERQIIKKEGKKYIFTHDCILETIYATINESTKVEIHKKVGDILEERHCRNIDPAVNLLAYHYSNSADKQKAVKYLFLAGDSSEHNAMYMDFFAKYRKAISILEDIDYPEKESVLFRGRFKLLFSCTHEPDYTLEAVPKLLEKLYMLAGGEEKIRKVVKTFKLVYKLINSLPSKMSEKIKDKLKKSYPPYDIPEPKDYPHIIAKLVEIRLYEGTAKYEKGHNSEVIDIVDEVIENYLPEKNSLEYACVLLTRGGAYSGTGRFTTLIREMQECISILNKNKDKLNRKQIYFLAAAWFWHNDGQVHLGNLKKKYVDALHEIAKENNFNDLMGWNYGCQFWEQAYQGNEPGFRTYGEKIDDIIKKLGYPAVMTVWYYIYLAFFYIYRGEFDKSEKCLAKTGKLKFSKTGHEFGYIKLFNALQYVYQGKTDQGLPLLEDSVEFSWKYDLDIASMAKLCLIEEYIKKGEINKASSLLPEVESRVTSYEYRYFLGQIILYRLWGNLRLKEKNFEDAKKYYEKSLQLANKFYYPLYEGLTYLALGEYYMNLTQYSKAKECLSKAAEKFKEINNEYQLKKVKVLEESCI